jgi:hypothetical protein
MSRDVFENENECQLTSTFSLNRHLIVTCLVLRAISISKESIDV